jgi:hypothetical protein
MAPLPSFHHIIIIIIIIDDTILQKNLKIGLIVDKILFYLLKMSLTHRCYVIDKNIHMKKTHCFTETPTNQAHDSSMVYIILPKSSIEVIQHGQRKLEEAVQKSRYRRTSSNSVGIRDFVEPKMIRMLRPTQLKINQSSNSVDIKTYATKR